MQTKGYDAFLTKTYRLTNVPNDPKIRKRIAELIHRFRSIHEEPSRIWVLLESMIGRSNRYSRELGKSFSEQLGIPNEKISQAKELFYSLTQEEQDLISAVFSSVIEHINTAVKIGEHYYLIDINAQQFGSKYDELVFVRLDEANENGIVPLEDVEADLFDRKLDFVVGPLKKRFENEQRIIREYMVIFQQASKRRNP